MAFQHRKFLLEQINSQVELKYKSCYICYPGCPDECKYFSSPPPPPSRPHQISTILIVMLCVLGGAFLFLSYFTISRYSRRRRNSLPLDNHNFRQDFDEHQGPVVDHPIWHIRTVGLPQSVIDSIAIFRYKKDERLMEGSDCAVCLNEFQENERFRVLPKCSHGFHVDCIDMWLRSHKNCPVCRALVVVENTSGSGDHANSVEIGLSVSGLSNENRVENDVAREANGAERNTDQLDDNKVGEILSIGRFNKFNSRNGGIRVLSDLADHHRAKLDPDQLQRVRRSVSMDFNSASIIDHKKGEGRSD